VLDSDPLREAGFPRRGHGRHWASQLQPTTGHPGDAIDWPHSAAWWAICKTPRAAPGHPRGDVCGCSISSSASSARFSGRRRFRGSPSSRPRTGSRVHPGGTTIWGMFPRNSTIPPLAIAFPEEAAPITAARQMVGPLSGRPMKSIIASTCRNDAARAFFVGPGRLELATKINSPTTGDYVRIVSSVRFDEFGLFQYEGE